MSLLIHLVRYFGLAVALGGLLTLAAVVPGLPSFALQAVAGAFAILAIIVGYMWYRAVTEAALKRGYLRRRSTLAGEYAIAFLLVAVTALYALTPLTLQTQTQQGACDASCRAYKNRVTTIEYFILALTLVAGLLAFGPIIFGRTILGPVLQEVQYMAGAMFLIMLFFTLLLFPLHVVFVDCWTRPYATGSPPDGCYIDMCKLASSGPPLLRFLFSLILPPDYVCQSQPTQSPPT